MHEDYGDLPEGGDDLEIIAPTDLARSRSSMNLTELKKRPISDLVKLAETMGLENMGRSRKQDIIFGVLKAHARKGRLWFPAFVRLQLPGRAGRHLCVPKPDSPLQLAHRRFDFRIDSPAERR
jgi:hypothetical protein